MRAFLRGLVAGFLLSCLRATPGELLDWGVAGARTAYGWRTAALFAVAIGLWTARQRSLTTGFLLGACLGFAVHGLLLANAWPAAGTFTKIAVIVAGLVALAAIRPGRREEEADVGRSRLVDLGLMTGGIGAAIALEGVARHVRLFQGGLAQDDTVSALACLALLLLGAAAFGWIAASRPLRGLSLPIALAASASAGFLSLAVVARIGVPEGYKPYLDRFGLDGALRGTLAYDALIAGSCFVVPALLLGAGLHGAGGRYRLRAALFGGAVGLFLVQALLRTDPGSPASAAQPSSAGLVPLGALIAAAGAVLAILSLADRGVWARWGGIAACIALASPSLLRKVDPLHVLSPWARRPVYPLFVADVPEGLLTVESFGLLGGSWLYVTLDRRLLTPEFEGAVADALRLRASLELLPREKREQRRIKMLLVGQVTPDRLRILTDGGVVRIDRSAAWWSSMARLEEALWSALPEPYPRATGDILDPGEACDRLAQGQYDLVVVTAVPGDAPRPRKARAPEATTLVRWIDLDEPAAHVDLGDRVALILDGLERPALALVDHAGAASEGDYAPLLLRGGERRSAPTPLAWVCKWPFDRDTGRSYEAREEMMHRLASAERGGPLEDVTTGFELFFEGQGPSSQFEHAADRVELPDACLDRFRAAALSGPLDPTLRRTWETLAQVLAGKRWIEKIYAYVLPVAEKHRPWPVLERTLARADLESLEPEEAVSRLEPLRELTPEDFETWFLLGEAYCAAGDSAKAREHWRRAMWLETSDRASKRKAALALARSGDPEGLEAARQFLLENPDDEELKALLSAPDPSAPPRDPCAR